MNYRTHICGGFAVGAVAVSTLGIDRLGVVGSGLLVGASLLGSLLPDIDKKGTYIYNRLPIIGWFAKMAGHRTLFHAPLIYTVITIALSLMVGFNPIVLGLYLGVMSHIILDTLNYKGIPWLYPIIKTKFHMARIKAGSFSDTVIGGICIAIAVVVLFR